MERKMEFFKNIESEHGKTYGKFPSENAMGNAPQATQVRYKRQIILAQQRNINRKKSM
jgi:hypothetical protein